MFVSLLLVYSFVEGAVTGAKEKKKRGNIKVIGRIVVEVGFL
nr:hypothetical protein [Brevibacillus reuszeri]